MTSNTLEFFVKMKDLMSSGLAKLAHNSQNTFTKIKSNVATATASTKFMSHSVDELREKLRRVNEVRFGTVMKSEFNQATRAARSLESQITRMEGRRSGGRSRILSMAASYIGPIAIAAGLMSFGKSSLNAAMNFQATQKSFGVLTGNREVGNNLANQLRGLKQDTIMGVSVYANAQRMLSFGVAANKVVPDLKMLGDISMGDANKLKRVTLAFSEVTAAGRLNGRRMLQFVNAGFNPLQEISRTTGKSMEYLTKQMSKGGISAKMVEDALKSSTSAGGRFADMMNVIGDTSYGKMKKMEGQWANLKINVGDALMPMATGFMDLASHALKALDIEKSIPDTLLSEKLEINSLVGSITDLNTSNGVRVRLLNTLKIKYPDIFGDIDTETIKNGDLLKKLNDVNQAYERKIGLAAQALIADNADKSANEDLGLATRATAQAKFNEQNPNAGWYDQNFKYLSLLDNARITRLARGAGTLGQGSKTLTSVAKELVDEAGNYLDDKSKALNEKASMENNGLLSDAWAAYRNKTFHGIKRMDFMNKIIEIQQKMKAGTANTDDLDKLKSYMPGVTAAGIKGNGGTGTGDGNGDGTGGKSVAAGITGGGPRVINISIGKMVEKLEIHASGADAGLADMEHKVEEHFLRILNSGASVQN